MLKRIWDFFKAPRRWLFLIVTGLFAGALTGVFLVLGDTGTSEKVNVFAYVLYALSAVLLAYFVYCIIYFIPRIKRSAKEQAQKHEFTRKLFGQYGFRTVAFAVVAFAISIGNAVVNGVLGIVYASLWFIALGAYYLLLSVMRGGILVYHGKKRKTNLEDSPELIKRKEIKTYRTCGILLILLPVALSFAILEMVVSDRAFVKPGIMIYVASAYTFYKIIMSVYNFAKAHKSDDMTVRAIRNVNFADALVSVLALQTAMFHEFSPETGLGYANGIMGAIVCVLTVAVGIFMAVNGTKKLKLLDEEIRSERREV